MTPYQLKPWTQVVTPHSDITTGNLSNDIFAASLSQVVRQDPNCPAVYRDARKFFEATYLTKELRSLLEDVLKGLCGQATDTVLQLRTPFGGGKTHSLVSLYHITQHRQELNSIDNLSTLPDPGKVSVLSFIGFDKGAQSGIEINGQKILTPWGYLIWQLGQQRHQDLFSLIAEEDAQRIAPGNDTLRRIIGNEPTLILLDEFLSYVDSAMGVTVGDSTFGRQVLTFVQRLTEVVRELPKTVMVYSLQASVKEAIGNEGLLEVLDKLVSRVDAKKEPVSGDEVMKVIQRRLFSTVGDPAIIQEVARQQAELYRRFYYTYADSDRSKQEIDQQAQILAERIESSYPFHPDLLDLMYHRWGSLPSYQRTRGALQFLARTVAYLWQQNDPLWLIYPGSIPLIDINVKQSFFSQVGQQDAYESVIAADIAGRKAKVEIVNQRLGNDAPAIAPLKIATRLAVAILMYSFGAKSGEDRGVMEQEIAASCLTETLDRTTLTAALSDLREELLYLHYVGKRYRFETKPNLNKLIADEESKISAEDSLQVIREQLGSGLKADKGEIILWPKDSSCIPDNLTKFIVTYLDGSWAEKSPDVIKESLMNWVEYRGNSKRISKNCLAFVVPNRQQMDKARSTARIYQAIVSLLGQKNQYKFSEEDLSELKEKQNNSKDTLKAAINRLYESIALPIPNGEGTSPIVLKIIDLQSQLNTSNPLQERVLEALRSDVFNSLTVTKLMRLSGLSSDRPHIQVLELIQAFFQYPTHPKLLNEKPIKQALLQAIEQGQVGYIPQLEETAEKQPIVDHPERISSQVRIPLDELDSAGYLLEKEFMTALLATYQAQQIQPVPPVDDDPLEETIDSAENDQPSPEYPKTNPTQLVTSEKTGSSTVEKSVLVNILEGRQPARKYTIKANLKSTQLFELMSILQNLSDQSAQVDMQVTITAYAKDQFDLNWIKGAIEEPLDEADIMASTTLT